VLKEGYSIAILFVKGSAKAEANILFRLRRYSIITTEAQPFRGKIGAAGIIVL
jgi:hypothetical protein